MIIKESTHKIILSKQEKLLLRKWNGWKDPFFENIVLMLLQNKVPDNVERIKSSSNAYVWKAYRDGEAIYIKIFRSRGIRDRLILRKTRAYRAAVGTKMLFREGFHAPALLSQGDVIKRLLIQKSFLVTREVNESYDIYAYIEQFFSTGLSQTGLKEKRDDIYKIGRIIGRLHKRGICHGDLRPGNILIQRTAHDIRCYFIDNERNSYFAGTIPERLREKNLVQINMIVSPAITFTDRLRFFKAYLEENPELKTESKKWLRNIFLHTRGRLQKTMPGLWQKH